MERNDYIYFLLEQPYKLGHLLGFNKLTELHNDWIVDMVRGSEDATLQAHRGSYKTTCVSLALAIIILLLPNKTTIFLRKTDEDVKEIIKQVKNILLNPKFQYFATKIYGMELSLTVDNSTEVSTNLAQNTKGTSQLLAVGIGGALTGKHSDYIFTDDIVNMKDRVSRAKRNETIAVYQELQNIKNRGGRIYNTGTPWHKDDCFLIMPKPRVFDCYTTGLISDKELDAIRQSMTPSLFCANYEMKHIASEDTLFKESPKFFDDKELLNGAIVHIDSAYSGSDSCALTIMKRVGDKYFAFGTTYKGHIDDILDTWLVLVKHYKGGTIYSEDNGDKGYIVKEIKKKGCPSKSYHEKTNKFIKISSFLKPVWKDIVWHRETDSEYLNNILDYNEFAEHDDSVDSCASAVRLLSKPKRKSLL